MEGLGVPAAEIAAAAKTKGDPYPLHADMSINGNVAVLKGSPEGEYFFFAVHPHGQWLCGKAWHHEDRHDPGDMTKCYVRLELKDQDLHLSVRMEDSDNPNDPDLTKLPAAAGSAGTCRADAAPDRRGRRGKPTCLSGASSGVRLAPPSEHP